MKSAANNEDADQPSSTKSALRLGFHMLTNVGPTRIINVDPTLKQGNLYNMSYVGPTLPPSRWPNRGPMNKLTLVQRHLPTLGLRSKQPKNYINNL